MSDTAIRAHVRQTRTAAGSSTAACAVGVGAVIVLGVNDGGYFEETWRPALVALLAIVCAYLLHGRSPETRLEVAALCALAGLAALMVSSAAWGVEGTEAVREAERCSLYLAALAAFLLTLRVTTVRVFLVGVLGGVVALNGFALLQRAVAPRPLDPYQGSLLAEPVGYANALGLLSAIGLLLSLGLALDERGLGWGVAAGCVCGCALVLTSSRGAWLATVVGLVVLFVLRSPNARVRIALVAVSLGALALGLAHVSFGDRPAYWRVAVAETARQDLLGAGAGSFDDVWAEHRPIPAFVRDAHSLYLETAAELGVVGLAMLLAALGAPVLAALRARHRSLAALAAPPYAAFLVHAGLDWDWEMPVTILAGLACGAVLLVSARRS